MSFGGFGKNSGPSTPPSAQIPFGNFPPSPSPVSSRSAIDYSDLGPPDGAALPHLASSRPFPDTLKSNETPLRWGDHGAQTYYQRPPGLVPRVTSSHSKTPPFTRTAEAQYIERTSSPYSHSPNEISTPKNSRNVVEIDKRRSPPPSAQTSLGNFPMSPSLPRPVSSRSSIDYSDLGPPEGAASPHLASSRPFSDTFKSNETSLRWGDRGARTYQRPPSLMPRVTSNHSKTSSFTRTPEAQYVERISSPYSQSPNEISTSKNSRNVIESDKRRSPPPNFQNDLYAGGQHTQSKEVQQASDFRIQSQSEVAGDRPMHFPALKRTKIALQSSPDQLFEDNLDPSREVERELLAKERRLARFKNELSQPLQSHSTIRNQKVPANAPNPSTSGRLNLSDDPTTGLGDSAGGNSDYEGLLSSSIVGLCPDMCPESERAERERKGDLDQYERLDGDRNLTSEFLAVKKYTRTAEREADLIRPMPILRKTMDYLLSLLDEPYDDRFLGLYNFLWDRMRAIRMDLRMQHIFNLEAVSLLEQMIRLHIIAMHELCEYTKGEGFSEGFDAHLNIEQMNKTSVELFQLYDDHRKKGIHVPSEREFRGYYALLKLDKHPGYKVEPAELSLDLAKMTPDMRQTPEVLFARAVARACRTGNFIAFFRLARKASYLQACLMHAHFSKLRTQALASLHSGLQINQGIPITVVAKWLAMEEEDIENLLEYYGFSVKEFGEPYMVKENTFISVENDFPVKRSKLVHSKRSRMIVRDVSFSSQNESYADVEVKRFQPKKVPEPIPIPVQPVVPESSTQLHDEKMHDLGTISSPKGTLRKDKASIALTTPVKDIVGHEVQWSAASPLGLNFSNSSFGHIQSQVEFSHKPVFRNSFAEPKPCLETTAPIITQEMAEENRYPVVSFDSVVHTPIPQFTDYLEDEGQTFVVMEEDKSDEVTTSYYDKEVEEAKLKLMMRIWKRRAAKKRELRERKQLTANAALSLLSMGPPIWQFEQPGSFGTFNIDHFMSERHEIRERSWSVLNPSEVVAPKLVEKNPDAKCLCWKLLLLSQEENIIPPNQITTASSWLQSKFMPAKNDFNQNLLVSSPGLSIWRTWVPSRSSVDDLTCCLSVIKSITFYEDQNKEILTGTNAVVFVLSQHIPIELQKKRLHSFVTSLPSGSRLPLLILSVVFDDPSNIVKTLGFGEIDKSKVASFYVTYLTKKSDGFLSDEDLRKGLEWLASESPPQILVRGIKTRELVLSYLNFLGCSTNNNTPNNCISAFNEALDRSMKDVINAAHENPTGWPCPDIDMLDESSDEYIAIVSYLPSTGWSRASKIDMLMRALNESKLPAMEDDDLCWLYRGCNSGRDIENQKLRLEKCVIKYLTKTSRMMGMDLARKEANIMIQKFVRLELRNSTYFMIPNWILMFQRIFGWRLMNLTSGESSSTYVLAKHYLVTPSREAADESEFEVVNPTLDELVEVGYRTNGGFESNHVDYEGFQVLSHSTRDNKVVLVETEEKSFEDYEHTETEENNEGGRLVHADKDNTEEEADKLSRLLEKCNILQNKIDEKLSIFF